MAATKLLSLLALAFVAIVALSSAPLHVNALAAGRSQVAHHAHDAVAKRKRSDSSSPSSSGRCIPRPSSSLDSFPPPTSIPTSTPTSTTPPPATSTTSSAAPSPTSGGGKGCLAWGGDDSFLSNYAFPGISYLYTWSSLCPANLSSGIECMPMLWGYDQIAEFSATVVAGYANIAMGMNEPNEPSQSNIAPADACDMWMKYLNPLQYQGYELVSPACTDDDAGLTWYQEFFAACKQNADFHVDFVAFHAYTTNATDLINYATTLHNTYNLDIFLTEFADQNFSGTGGQASMDDIWNFAGQVTQFAASTPWFKAACPFGAMMDLQGVNTLNSLMDSNGEPTDLAKFYFDNL